MYPTIVIVLVESQRSITDVCSTHISPTQVAGQLGQTETRPPTVGITFAANKGHSTMMGSGYDSQYIQGSVLLENGGAET